MVQNERGGTSQRSLRFAQPTERRSASAKALVDRRCVSNLGQLQRHDMECAAHAAKLQQRALLDERAAQDSRLEVVDAGPYRHPRRTEPGGVQTNQRPGHFARGIGLPGIEEKLSLQGKRSFLREWHLDLSAGRDHHWETGCEHTLDIP
jgi:hypothetical protein